MFVHVSSALNLIVLMCAVLVLAANIGPVRPVGVRTAVELLERKRIQNTFARPPLAALTLAAVPRDAPLREGLLSAELPNQRSETVSLPLT